MQPTNPTVFWSLHSDTPHLWIFKIIMLMNYGLEDELSLLVIFRLIQSLYTFFYAEEIRQKSMTPDEMIE